MQRNAIQCSHCGKNFVRITDKTPLVNRSDGKRFHVTLFAGPDPRPKVSGGFDQGQLICDFVYAHDRFGPKNHTILVVVSIVDDNPDHVIHQIEAAADKLAELIETGNRLADLYTFNGRELISQALI